MSVLCLCEMIIHLVHSKDLVVIIYIIVSSRRGSGPGGGGARGHVPP